MKNKQIIIFTLILSLMILSSLSVVSAEQKWGYYPSGSTNGASGSGNVGFGASIDIVNEREVIFGGASDLRAITGTVNVKLVVFDDYNLIHVSEPVAVDSVFGWRNFTFTSNFPVVGDGLLYTAFVIADGGLYVRQSTTADGIIWFSNNSYTTPVYSDPYTIEEGANSFNIILYTMEEDEVPGTTTTPTAPAANWWDVLAEYSGLIIPLVIILVISIICGYFGGVWGFFAGLNVSIILIYAIMGSSVFPLWGVVLLAIVDGLLLFGKIGGSFRKE